MSGNIVCEVVDIWRWFLINDILLSRWFIVIQISSGFLKDGGPLGIGGFIDGVGLSELIEGVVVGIGRELVRGDAQVLVGGGLVVEERSGGSSVVVGPLHGGGGEGLELLGFQGVGEVRSVGRRLVHEFVGFSCWHVAEELFMSGLVVVFPGHSSWHIRHIGTDARFVVEIAHIRRGVLNLFIFLSVGLIGVEVDNGLFVVGNPGDGGGLEGQERLGRGFEVEVAQKGRGLLVQFVGIGRGLVVVKIHAWLLVGLSPENWSGLVVFVALGLCVEVVVVEVWRGFIDFLIAVSGGFMIIKRHCGRLIVSGPGDGSRLIRHVTLSDFIVVEVVPSGRGRGCVLVLGGLGVVLVEVDEGFFVVGGPGHLGDGGSASFLVRLDLSHGGLGVTGMDGGSAEEGNQSEVRSSLHFRCNYKLIEE